MESSATKNPEPRHWLHCKTCDHNFPVYRDVHRRKDQAFPLMNSGHICFSGPHCTHHHLLTWMPDNEEEDEIWEIICGDCHHAVPLPYDSEIQSDTADKYIPAEFNCPQHHVPQWPYETTRPNILSRHMPKAKRSMPHFTF